MKRPSPELAAAVILPAAAAGWWHLLPAASVDARLAVLTAALAIGYGTYLFASGRPQTAPLRLGLFAALGICCAAELRNGAGLYRHALHLWAARIRAHGTAVAKRELSSEAEVWPRRTIDAEYAALPAPAHAELAAELAPLVDDFRRLWLTRGRPGGLHDSTGRFERLLAVYRGGDP